MTDRRPLGMMPEHTYEPSYCNQALMAAGLDIEPPNTLAMLSRTIADAETAEKARQREAVARSLVPADGSMIRMLRERRHWSRAALSRLSGCSGWTIYAIETGRYDSMRGTTANGLAEALGVPVEAITLADERAAD